MLNIEDVAKYFIWFGQDHEDPATHLKLQKLCYFAEAYYLAIHNEPLTGASFEAWTHGPVSRRLWCNYRNNGWLPIVDEQIKPELPENIEGFLSEIADVFYGYDGYQLEQISHGDTAWVKARGDLPLEASCTTVIDPKDMQEFYSRYINN